MPSRATVAFKTGRLPTMTLTTTVAKGKDICAESRTLSGVQRAILILSCFLLLRGFEVTVTRLFLTQALVDRDQSMA